MCFWIFYPYFWWDWHVLVISLLIQSQIYSTVVWLFLPVTVDSDIIPGGLWWSLCGPSKYQKPAGYGGSLHVVHSDAASGKAGKSFSASAGPDLKWLSCHCLLREARMEIDTSTDEAKGCRGASRAITEKQQNVAREACEAQGMCQHNSYLKCLITRLATVFLFFPLSDYFITLPYMYGLFWNQIHTLFWPWNSRFYCGSALRYVAILL